MTQTYKDFDATELFCPQCKRAVAVKKKIVADSEGRRKI